MIVFFLCLALSVLSLIAVERSLLLGVERSSLFRRLSLLSIMPVLVFFCTLVMISYRPIFSLAGTLCALGVITVLNNAKYRTLKEPLVFSDFALFRQAILHPRLYVKFIGPWKIAALTFLILGSIAAAIIIEPPLIPRHDLSDYLPALMYLSVILGMIYAITRGILRKPFLRLLRKFGAAVDVQLDPTCLPMVACLIVYFFLANEMVPSRADKAKKAKKKARETAVRTISENTPSSADSLPWPMAESLPPVVVVVQSESFFDLRRISPEIPRNLLPNWDRVRDRSIYRGHLGVPAWGANTLRTEFAFLSGLPSEALGVHRFNPYLHLCRQPIWTLAHQLRAMGYRTVCVHPYAADFFNRSHVYPIMGFDAFIDEGAFDGAERFGPYISDRAVADKILDLAAEREGPLFVFAITMENHGRWEPGRLDGFAPPEETGPLLGSEPLGLFARHAVNADRMLRRLTVGLRAGPGDAVLCMYGDHLPSLPDTFRRLGFAEEGTDYLIWRKTGGNPRDVDVSVDALGRLLFDAMLGQANPSGVKARSRRSHTLKPAAE